VAVRRGIRMTRRPSWSSLLHNVFRASVAGSAARTESGLDQAREDLAR
jgi:hypothetical protein